MGVESGWIQIQMEMTKIDVSFTVWLVTETNIVSAQTMEVEAN